MQTFTFRLPFVSTGTPRTRSRRPRRQGSGWRLRGVGGDVRCSALALLDSTPVKRALRIGGTALGVAGATAGLAVLLLHFLSIASTRWAALTSAVPWILCAGGIGLLGGIGALAVTRHRVAIVATSLAALLLVPAAITQVPRFVGDDVTNTGPGLVALTINLEFGQGDAAKVAEVVERRDVDLLFVQELTPEAASSLTALLADTLPHDALVPAETAVGSGIYARFPLDDVEVLPDTYLTTVFATAEVPGYGPVRVGSAHPVPPWPVHREGWEAELDQIRTSLHGVGDLPVVVGGDFNATWDHPEFRRLLDDGYRDAAEQAGAGWLPTWPADRVVALIGIDHVLVRGAQAAHVTSLTVPGTDHRAVLAVTVLP